MLCSLILWTSTKIAQIVSLGSKMALPQGHLLYIDSYREKLKKKFFSETRMPTGPFKAKVYLEPLQAGQLKFVCHIWVTWSGWPPSPYMVKIP